MVQKNSSETEQEMAVRLSRAALETVFNALTKGMCAKDIHHKYLPRAYYDTDDLLLYHYKKALRVQYKPGKAGRLGSYEQTVKYLLPPDEKASVKGVSSRRECRNSISGPQPEPHQIADRAAREEIISVIKNKKLKHIFTAAVERRYFNATVGADSGRGTVEVAFDVGHLLLSNGVTKPLVLIELEHKSGSVAAIGTMWEKIKEIAPTARIQLKSKGQQGTELYLKHHPEIKI